MSAQQLRSAISNGFGLDNLWNVVRIAFALLRSERLTHPSIPLTIAAIATSLAQHQDSGEVLADEWDVIEAHLRPHLEGLIDLIESTDQRQVCSALDATARAFTDTLRARP